MYFASRDEKITQGKNTFAQIKLNETNGINE